MKVLLLSDSYPPFVGGMERHVSLLGKELVQRGHDVTVYTVQHNNLLKTETVNGVNIIRGKGLLQWIPFLHSGPQSRDIPPVRDLLVTRNLKKIVAKERPDIIHAHGWLLSSLLPFKKETCLPLVATIHDYRFICPNQMMLTSFGKMCTLPLTSRCATCAKDMYGSLRSILVHRCVKSKKDKLSAVDKFIAVSSFVEQVHSKYLVPGSDIVTIPNFYEIQKESYGREKSWYFPEDFILFVGVLAPYKGINILIEAYRKEKKKLILVLIGKKVRDCSYKSDTNIKIIEDAPEHLVREAFSKCRFVVIPSLWPDPCPTVAFEAMAAKKPIIASGIGGLTDIVINEKTGLLVPPNNSSSLSQAIQKLISQSDLAQEMGELAYRRLRSTFDTQVVVPKIENVYKNLI